LIDQLLDVIRLETERAESLQGFQIVHSLGGGTGSGMGSLLLCKLREEFPDKMLWTWSLTETSIDECVLRPYNNMLAMQYLIENTDAVVYIDDDASYKACLRGRITKPTYNHLNTITANIMSNVTCSMRLDSSEFTSLRKISTNLVPFPRQHFLTVGTSPLNSEFIENTGDHSVTPVTLAEISSQLFEPQNMMLAIDDQNKSWKHLATMCSFRGTMHPLEIADFINVTRDKRSSNFVPWIPDNVKWTHCETSAPGVNMSGTYLANSTAVIDIFQQLETQFSALFRRKAFLYHYRGEGMDEMEFKEAHANMKDLIAEYQQYQDIDIETRLGEHYCSDDEVE
jgi:tubulin beta